jgi:hypothetical protein
MCWADVSLRPQVRDALHGDLPSWKERAHQHWQRIDLVSRLGVCFLSFESLWCMKQVKTAHLVPCLQSPGTDRLDLESVRAVKSSRFFVAGDVTSPDTHRKLKNPVDSSVSRCA